MVVADLFQVLKALEDVALMKELVGNDVDWIIDEKTLDETM